MPNIKMLDERAVHAHALMIDLIDSAAELFRDRKLRFTAADCVKYAEMTLDVQSRILMNDDNE